MAKKRRKNPHAVALGRMGAAKGGARKAALARWAAVPPEERQELARKAARARWSRPKRLAGWAADPSRLR